MSHSMPKTWSSNSTRPDDAWLTFGRPVGAVTSPRADYLANYGPDLSYGSFGGRYADLWLELRLP